MNTITELIQVYVSINKEVMSKNLEPVNSYFIELTNVLDSIQRTLMGITVTSTTTNLTLWELYRKEQDQGKLLSTQSSSRKLAEIPQSPSNMRQIEELDIQIDQFSNIVNRALRTCCFCRYRKLFGTIEQNNILLRKNFEGQHFWVRSTSGVKLDCMFFPCTSGEEPQINENTNPASNIRYINEPTILVCNPNALLYQ